MPLSIVILAAGKGTRMKSARPKVIHQLAGRPMLQHVINTAKKLDPQQIVIVVGHESQQVKEQLADQALIFVEQSQQLGTGHAVAQCSDVLSPGNDVLVLYGDVPLIQSTTLNKLWVLGQQGNVVCLLSFMAENPAGYGRIIRDGQGNVTAIIEEKDADEKTRMIHESNSGILFIKNTEFGYLLDSLDADNAQQEYYLTDVVKHAVSVNHQVAALVCEDEYQVQGVNNQQQLAFVESRHRLLQAEKLMNAGVKIVDPARIDIRGEVLAGEDVEIDVNCIFEGRVILESGVKIGANCILKECTIGKNSIVQPMTIIEQSDIGDHNEIGPFSRIRPQTETRSTAKIGNFVEIKKSVIGSGSKVNHLSYVGDTEMGAKVNIGAGTITCNYDGAFKHKTIIEDDVFVGSDSQLVAPVKLSQGSTIGAGSTITKDTPKNELTLSRSKQISLKGWNRPDKTEKKS